MNFLEEIFNALAEFFHYKNNKKMQLGDIDRRAYDKIKLLVEKYEEKVLGKEKNEGTPDGIDPESGDAYYNMHVEFVSLHHEMSRNGKRRAMFKFKALDGPFKDGVYKYIPVIHNIYHRYPTDYTTENNFVKKHLKFDGYYDSTDDDMLAEYDKDVNSNLPGKYVYSIRYKYKDTDKPVSKIEMYDEETEPKNR